MLNKINKESWIKFIILKFEETGKQISENHAELIALLMKNTPWYVQQLSHYIWVKTKTKVTVQNFKLALEELVYSNSPLFIREIEFMSATQINFLKAVVNEVKRLSATENL